MKYIYKLAPLAFFLFTGCTGVSFSPLSQSISKDQSCEVCRSTVNEAFQVPNSSGKADILFVVDSTPAMFVTLTQMASRLGNFLNSLGSVDYQIGVMNSSMSSSDGYAFPLGQLMNMSSDPLEYPIPTAGYTTYILNSGVADAQYILGQSLSFAGMTWPTTGAGPGFCAAPPYCTAGAPQPLKALASAINNPKAGGNAQFFRAGSTLIPVILTSSDENGGQSGATQPSDVVTAFNGSSLATTMQGMKAVTFEVKPGDTACMNIYNGPMVGSIAGGFAAYGTKVDQFASLTKGTSNSICSSDFSSALGGISGLLGAQVSVFTLKQTPLANTLKVVTVPSTTISYSLQNNVLTFSQPLPIGTTVSVSYQITVN